MHDPVLLCNKTHQSCTVTTKETINTEEKKTEKKARKQCHITYWSFINSLGEGVPFLDLLVVFARVLRQSLGFTHHQLGLLCIPEVRDGEPASDVLSSLVLTSANGKPAVSTVFFSLSLSLSLSLSRSLSLQPSLSFLLFFKNLLHP